MLWVNQNVHAMIVVLTFAFLRYGIALQISNKRSR